MMATGPEILIEIALISFVILSFACEVFETQTVRGAGRYIFWKKIDSRVELS